MHRELDLVTTPAGDLVAMVHCNNGASELNAWAGLFAEFARALGSGADSGTSSRPCSDRRWMARRTAADCSRTTICPASRSPGWRRGGRSSCARPTARFDLATFMRTQLYASLATLRIGMDVLQKDEGVRLDTMFAHGGLFKTKGVAQRFLAAAIDTPVSVGDVAAEGGAWGIAVLAAFAADPNGRTLVDFLADEVFAGVELDTIEPDPADVRGFDAYLRRYVDGLAVERAAVAHG